MEKRRNSSHPQRVSLGRCVKQLMECRIDQAIIKNEGSSTASYDYDVMNKEIQTDCRNLEVCDSCLETTTFITELVGYISVEIEDSLTKSYKEEINDNIFNITKLGSTIKLTNSITQDYHKIGDKLNTVIKDKEHLLKNLSNMERLNTSNEDKIKELNEIIDKCSTELENNRKELESANNYIKVLQEEKEVLQQRYNDFDPIINNLTNEIKILQNKRLECQKQMDSKMRSHEQVVKMYKSEVNKLNISNSTLTTKLHTCQVKFDNLFTKYSKLSKIKFKLDNSLDEISHSLKTMHTMADNINSSVNNTTERTTALKEKTKELLNVYKEQNGITDKFSKFSQIIQSTTGKPRSNYGFNDCEIQGNPVLDFTRQIQENEKAIQKLELQNKKFQSILTVYQKTKCDA